MSSEQVELVTRPLKTGLINAPTSICNSLLSTNIPVQNVVFQLTKDKRTIVVGWTGMSSSKPGTIEIDNHLASSLEFQQRDKLTLKVKMNLPLATMVHVEPLTVEDWELIEMNSAQIEDRMLNQVRAVSLNQVLTVFPSATDHANLKVVKIEPLGTDLAKLGNDTEVVIAPKVRTKKKKSTTKSVTTTSYSKRRREVNGPVVLLRGIALPHQNFPVDDKDYEFAVYVSSSTIKTLKNIEFVNVGVIKQKNSESASDKTPNQAPEQPLYTNRVMAKIIKHEDVFSDHVLLSKSLSYSLRVENSVGNIIRVETPRNQLINKPRTLVLKQFSNDKKAVIKPDHAKEKLIECGLFSSPLTNQMLIPPIDGLLSDGGVVEFKNVEGGWFVGNESLKVEIGPNLTFAEIEKSANSASDSNIVGIDNILNSLNGVIRDGSSTNSLLFGSRGSGKTAILKNISKGLLKDCIHSIWLSCSNISEDPISTIKDQLTKVINDASWFSPAVIFLDDLDKLIPAEVEHSDSNRTRQLAEIFKQLVESISQTRQVSIVASSNALESIHAYLVTSHLFEETFHLKSPDKTVRHEILEEAVRHLNMKTDEDFDVLEIAGSTEGYQPGDILTLVERAKHHSIIRNIEDNTTELDTLIQNDFESALQNFVPSSLRGVKLQKSNIKWSEIGGLKETKKILLETLEWPTKYAPIFQKCPLRLRSGLLLYGYPGCGKTLLASAIASESGLNFISIKGPEILNKYIGASEQSVRELFERAQAAKPCILFFDEFDSIAPKRGHDSTGVTDRVVNQMLTQMDGAEGLDGVYVLAATSRPDLIDSALLRPGRLDKSLLCGMPDFEERLDILQAVQGSMILDPSEPGLLENVAKNTEGYSGADLRAVLYNAYLDAVHDVVDLEESLDSSQPDSTADDSRLEFFEVNATKSAINPRAQLAEHAKTTKKLESLFATGLSEAFNKTSQPAEQKKTEVVITLRHIEKSLADTQPSISLNERRKLESIYDKFVNGRSGEMPNGTASDEIGGRTSLM